MGRRTAWALLVAGVVVVGAAVAVSRRVSSTSVARAGGAVSPAPEQPLPILDDGRPAAPLTGAASWLNSPPLTPQALHGTVVLYEFWTFGCINCRHVLPYVKGWYDRYHDAGFTVVGIHTPEFDYERDATNVAEFVTANDVHFPVALDPGGDVWRAWDNGYWPQFYLYDASGRLRRTHIGEGGYAETEDAIRTLLGIGPQEPRATV